MHAGADEKSERKRASQTRGVGLHTLQWCSKMIATSLWRKQPPDAHVSSPSQSKAQGKGLGQPQTHRSKIQFSLYQEYKELYAKDITVYALFLVHKLMVDK